MGCCGLAGANARVILARGVGTLFEARLRLGTFVIKRIGATWLP
jgi:hypothetical protein